MPRITVQLDSPIERSFRVEQVAGMLDVPLAERARHHLTADVPGLDEAWTIGAIVGPSGSGKTTLARAAFGGVHVAREWPRGRATVEVLGSAEREVGVRDWERERGGDWETGRRGEGDGTSGVADRRDAYPTIRQIARVLTAVGLGSVPTWLKPYEVLSTGERFRAELARAVLRVQGSGFRVQESGPCSESAPLLVFDEFTSVLDRRVARTVSAALARLIRSPRSKVQDPKSAEGRLRLVAVTCHADVMPWLAPDWMVELKDEGGGMKDEVGGMKDEMRMGRLTWPVWEHCELSLEVRRVPRSMWARFAGQHYLAGGLAASATCYGAFVVGEEDCVGFCAVVAALGWKKCKRITRLVTLPEFQGLGIASRMLAEVAQIEAARGNRVTITASHPAIVGHCSRSSGWRLSDVKKNGSTRQRFAGREIRSSIGRAVASFEFVGSPAQ